MKMPYREIYEKVQSLGGSLQDALELLDFMELKQERDMIARMEPGRVGEIEITEALDAEKSHDIIKRILYCHAEILAQNKILLQFVAMIPAVRAITVAESEAKNG